MLCQPDVRSQYFFCNIYCARDDVFHSLTDGREDANTFFALIFEKDSGLSCPMALRDLT